MNERQVRSILAGPAATVSESAPLRQAVQLMTKKRIRHVCVMREDALVGIISDRDLTRAMPADLLGEGVAFGKILDVIPASRIMTSEPLTISAAATLWDALQTMQEYRVGALPVVDEGRVVGLVTEADCLRHSFRARLAAQSAA